MKYEATNDPSLQDTYWEGFTQENEVTNLFVWNFRRELIHAAVNFPESWHDSSLYRPELHSKTPVGLALLADSAFPRIGGSMQGKILRARKMNEHGPRSGVPQSAWLSAVD